MSGVERKSIKLKNGNWENELWSLLDSGDGINCPLSNICEDRNNNRYCLSQDTEYNEFIHEFLEGDFLTPHISLGSLPEVSSCFKNALIFKLVIMLAHKYSQKMGLQEIPVSVDIDSIKNIGPPIEIRLIPLKSTHGAVWRLQNDGWVIHLNSQDSPARRRFTLYHELFHILAHSNASPIFKKTPAQKEGLFNELLADLFSGVIIMPREMMVKKWVETKNIHKIAEIFNVPETAMYLGLKHMKLI